MNNQIYAEASGWLIEFRTDDADAEARQRFETWLNTSPEHVRAYLEVTAIWEGIALIDPSRELDVDALIAGARAGTNVIPLAHCDSKPEAVQSRSMPESLPARRTWKYKAAASVLVGVLAVAALWQHYRDPILITGIGEQRSITLPDGSSVELNARSKIRLHFTRSERSIDLLQGQALFHVEKDPGRPFLVLAGATSVRAVGTQFDVYRKPSGTVVTVLEGRVAITPTDLGEKNNAPGPDTARRLELTAGEQVMVAASSPAQPQARAANLAAATAWTQHRLVFQQTPLDEVVEEFNRYNSRRLSLASPDLRSLHISGAFSSTNPLPLLRFLRSQAGIHVVEYDDRIVITRK